MILGGRASATLQKSYASCTVGNYTMFSTARRRCARSLLAPSQPKTDSLPLFLLPAFQAPAAARGFASTSPCQSKIGSAPLSIPPGVTFKVIPPSARERGARAQAMSTVQIKGPLGELSMDVPAYVNINQDPALSGPTLTVADTTDKKQKAMWGAHTFSRPLGFIATNPYQEQPEPTSRTTSSASAKVTLQSSASTVSVTVLPLKRPLRPSNRNIPARSS